MTDRRTFLGALAGGLLALPLAAEAQPAGQVRRIGYLGYSVPGSDPSGIAGLRQGLHELGYVENKNIVIEYRFAEDRPDRLASLIAELIDLKVDVLITQGTVVTAAAKRATRETPIISVSGDPVGSGFVQSLARPGGNITGLSLAQEESFGGKWLQLVRDAVPNASRVGIIWNPTNRSMAAAFKEINGTAPGLGIRLLSHPVQRPEDIDVAFAGLTRSPTGAFIILTDPLVVSEKARIVRLAAARRVPTVYGVREFVDAGGLMSYGPSLADLWRRAATYVDKILKGAKPGICPSSGPRSSSWSSTSRLRKPSA